MKHLIWIFLLSGCASTQHIKNDLGEPLRQCSTPNLYFIDDSVPSELRPEVEDAFNHWNSATTRLLFVDGGIPNMGVEKVTVIVKMEEFYQSELYCAKTTLFHMKGCTMGANITIDPNCSIDPKEFNTLIRHSIGTVMGLSNSIKPGTLMYYGINEGAQHPIDINDEEKAIINKLYHW